MREKKMIGEQVDKQKINYKLKKIGYIPMGRGCSGYVKLTH